MSAPLILASASPRRSALLAQAKIEYEVIPSDVQEWVNPAWTPSEAVMQLACQKAAAVAAANPGRLVLGADTVVTLDGRILGKPRDEQDAAEMLRALSGRGHEVYTGIALCKDDFRQLAFERTEVYFKKLSDEEIWDYIRSGEPMDKAGAYAIQGFALCWAEKVCGCVSNVIGLPLPLLCRMIDKL